MFISVLIRCETNGIEVSASTTWQSIGSPGFPGYYPDDAQCKFTIRAPETSQTIALKMMEFSLEEILNGCHDYLKISNGTLHIYMQYTP